MNYILPFVFAFIALFGLCHGFGALGDINALHDDMSFELDRQANSIDSISMTNPKLYKMVSDQLAGSLPERKWGKKDRGFKKFEKVDDVFKFTVPKQ